MKFIQTKDIKEYATLLDGLYPDFGNHFCHTILCWCDIMESGKETGEYWQVWIVKHESQTIGICGLYSLDNNIDTLWLGWLGIVPELRNKKLGVDVIEFLKSTAISIGSTTLMSYIDEDGKPLNFYKRAGFDVICTVGEYIKEHNIDLSSFEDENDYVIKYSLLK